MPSEVPEKAMGQTIPFNIRNIEPNPPCRFYTAAKESEENSESNTLAPL
jgi:hypothetical protein